MMLAAVICLGAGTVASATTNVTYTASGTFATPPLSGADMLKLAGYPYTINVYAAPNTTPAQSGPHFAAYTNVQMYGMVFSGLLNTTVPFGCAPGQSGCTPQLANLEFQVTSTNNIVNISAQVPLIGLTLQVLAKAPMPLDTFSSLRIRPFEQAATISSPSATLIYRDSSASTTLGCNGTVSTSVSTSQEPAGQAAALTMPAVPAMMPAALVARRRYV
jgi:hypothetical protein